MHIGMTGTRKGMGPRQQEAFFDILKHLDDGNMTLHHGDAKGADAQAHRMARKLGWRVEVHPPVDPKYRAFCRGDVIHPEKEYLERNRDIVNASSYLLGAPPNSTNTMRSGTWYTLRYAREQLPSHFFVVYPDGEVKNWFL